VRTVWKFPFPDDHPKGGAMRLDLGHGAYVCHVGVDPAGDGFLPCLWIEHDPTETRREERAFPFIGTGHQVPDRVVSNIGSVVTPRGLVWHCYEVRT
jgi:hypothetical protein